MSKKMSPPECNHEIYDKELLAIVRAFEEWRPEWAGTPIEDPIKIITDHKNLEYFMSTKQLNRWQARWAEFLSEFNFWITYRPGRQGTKSDSLTRRPGDLPEHADDERRQFQYQTILKRNLDDGVRPDEGVCPDEGIHHAVQLAPMLLDEMEFSVPRLAAMIYDLSEGDTLGGEESLKESPPRALGGDSHDEESMEESSRGSPPRAPEGESSDEEFTEESSRDSPASETDVVVVDADIPDRIRSAYEDDEIIQWVMHAKATGQRKIPFHLEHTEHLKLELGDCFIRDNLLYVGDRLYVLYNDEIRTKIIKITHESLVGGHAGRASTYDQVRWHYYWLNMTDSVTRFVKSCHVCKRSKAYRAGKQGLLKPLPIPQYYWHDISVNFITPLPVCLRYGREFQHIMVVMDRLSKKKKFTPLDSLEVDAVVQAFIEWIWREEGFPSS